MKEYLEQDSLIASSLNEYFTVKLNRQSIKGLDWSFYDHPQTGEKSFVTYIDIESMPSGKYFLELLLEVPRDGKLVTRRYREMPFIKE